MYDEKTKHLQIGIRENEILSLADEIMSPKFPISVSEDWGDRNATFSKNLVLMGHSFGGITVLGAAKDCKHAAAIIALDPWFWPHCNDVIGAADNQKVLMVMSEHFPAAVMNAKGSGQMSTLEKV
jgi:hypothetical protein